MSDLFKFDIPRDQLFTCSDPLYLNSNDVSTITKNASCKNQQLNTVTITKIVFLFFQESFVTGEKLTRGINSYDLNTGLFQYSNGR